MTQNSSPHHSKLAKARSTRWKIGIGVIAAAVIVLSLTQISSNTVYFFTPDEAFAKASDLQDQTIKVGGMVVPGSVDWKPQELDLQFTISDLKGNDIRISHKGTPPDMFKEGQGVVVEGLISADGKSMLGRKLMVKHSEEYKKPGDHANSIDKELLEKSMFKTYP